MSVNKEKINNKAELESDDKQHIWHPFTQMKEYIEEKPLIIEEGEGVYLKDIYGNSYIDGVSSLWVTTHGHRKKEIDDAIIRQIKKISHSTLLGLANTPTINLAKKLIQIVPQGLEKVFFSDNGSTAVEISLKIAFQYWQQKGEKYKSKTRFASLKNAYHGDTLGAVSVGGIDLFHNIYSPLLFRTFKAKSPYCYRCEDGLSYPDCKLFCAKDLEEILKNNSSEIAALIIEPMVQAAGGMIVFPKGYLKKARELCTKYNVLMITDEVATGFGRTGKMFACEHEKIAPDIMAVAKGITGGYLPLAATITTKEVYNAFLGDYSEFKTFFHGHTYTGNPLACAAALASLKIFEDEKVLDNLQVKISYLKERLQSFYELPGVGDIRQCGFITGIELVKNKASKEYYPLEEKIGVKVIMEARKRGVILRPLGNVIVLMPPLSISQNELRQLVDVTYEAIKAVS